MKNSVVPLENILVKSINNIVHPINFVNTFMLNLFTFMIKDDRLELVYKGEATQ